MIIHFVCAGNTYRSRLAEAYLNSKQLPNVTAISSGVEASKNKIKTISWFAKRLLKIFNIESFQKPKWTQTSKLMLDSADLTIFFDNKYYGYCVDKYGFDCANYENWEIEDLGVKIKDKLKRIEKTEKTFKLIRQKVDDLVKRRLE